MARPRIGIFGALAVLGGLLAWRLAQRQRASQGLLNRELSRWEDEGGSVASQVSPGATTTPAGSAGASRVSQTNATAHPNGMGEAWPFPHS